LGWARETRLTTGSNSIALDLGTISSLADFDYVYCYLRNTNHVAWTLHLKSASGKEVRVARQPAANSNEIASAALMAPPLSAGFVPPASDAVKPLVYAPRALPAGDEVVLVSVVDLARGGLDTNRLTSAVLDFHGKPGTAIRIGPLGRLRHYPGPLGPINESSR
jgi:hypothetical protein